MHRFFIFTPLFSGCLLNFSPFEEALFVADYSEKICSQYIDCIDGSADGDAQAAQSLSPAPYDTCMEWTSAPKTQGCTPDKERAVQCYAELEALETEMNASGECATLWTGEGLPSCATTYLNCVTDKPFGTVPPKAEIGPPSITNLDPFHGPTTGNTLVSIEGSGFDASTEVRFGDAVGEIVETKEEGLLVRTPSASAGAVSITITNAYGQTDHPQQFRFWEDISGETGIFGYLNASETVGGYWNTDSEWTSASIVFLSSSSPNTINYRKSLRIGTKEGCMMVNAGENELVLNTMGVQYPDLSLSTSESTLALGFSSAGTFTYSSESIDVSTASDYTLTADGVSGWPSFEINQVLSVPKPVVMERPNLYDAEMPEQSASESVPFSWVAEDSSYLTLRISESPEFKRFLGCSFADTASTGSIASQELPALGLFFDGRAILYVEVCRINEVDQGELAPINNGRIDMAGARCILGGLYIE